MRRSFRVATVFTGVAAITGGLGPTALAATTKTAAPEATTTTVCGANTGGVSRWLHVFYPNNDHPAECTHGSGFELATGTITAFCPGGTRGVLYGRLTATGSLAAISFSPANNTRFTFNGTNLALSGISVFDTGGGQKCES
jgi:hypothetical protein